MFPQHETKLPESNYIILADQNLSNLNKKVIQETLVCESHPVWHCVAKVTQQAGMEMPDLGRRGPSHETEGLVQTAGKPNLEKDLPKIEVCWMQISNLCSSWWPVRIGWKPLWWLHQPPLLPGVISLVCSGWATRHCLIKGNIPARFFSRMSWIWERSSLYSYQSSGPEWLCPIPPLRDTSEVKRPRWSSHRPLPPSILGPPHIEDYQWWVRKQPSQVERPLYWMLGCLAKWLRTHSQQNCTPPSTIGWPHH